MLRENLGDNSLKCQDINQFLLQMTFTQVTDDSGDSLHIAWSSGHFQERRKELTLTCSVVCIQCPTIKAATCYWLDKSSWCHSTSSRRRNILNCQEIVSSLSLGREVVPFGFKKSQGLREQFC